MSYQIIIITHLFIFFIGISFKIFFISYLDFEVTEKYSSPKINKSLDIIIFHFLNKIVVLKKFNAQNKSIKQFKNSVIIEFKLLMNGKI